MANYPLTGCSPESDISPEAGIVADYADDGTLRTRRTFTQTRYTLTLIHPRFTSADRTTLLSHYATHVGTAFNFVSPWGDTYSVQYIDEPRGQPESGGYWTLTSKLVGVKI